MGFRFDWCRAFVKGEQEKNTVRYAGFLLSKQATAVSLNPQQSVVHLLLDFGFVEEGTACPRVGKTSSPSGDRQMLTALHTPATQDVHALKHPPAMEVYEVIFAVMCSHAARFFFPLPVPFMASASYLSLFAVSAEGARCEAHRHRRHG